MFVPKLRLNRLQWKMILHTVISLLLAIAAHQYWAEQGRPEYVPVLLGVNVLLVALVASGYLFAQRYPRD